MTRILALVATFLLIIGAAGCGGGGGGGPSLSNNAALSNLTISAGTLSPAFQSTTRNYDVVVDPAVSLISITPTLADPAASVTVNGGTVASGTSSPAFALATGDNLIRVLVTAENGTSTNTYELTVHRLSDDAKLSVLGLSEGELDQIFQPSSFSYTATVGYLQASVRVRAETAHSDASVTVNEEGITAGAESADIPLIVGSNTIVISVTAEDGVSIESYRIEVTRANISSFAQRAYIKASNTDELDNFGYSVALSGSTLVVGSEDEASAATGIGGDQSDNSADNAGAVYVFNRDSAGSWSQQAYIKASNTDANDLFGFSVALSGNTLAVGSLFEDSSATGIDGAQSDNGATNSGAVYIFVRDAAGNWNQQAYIKASNTNQGDRFGWSVALFENTLAVGAPHEQSASVGIGGDQSDNGADNSGAAYIFTRDESGSWTQQAYIKASNAQGGDQFGYSVALSENTFAASAPHESSGATGINGDQADRTASGSGAVYVFSRDSSNTWTQQAYIKASNTDGGDFFGGAISLSGGTLAVAAQEEDSAAAGVNGNQQDNSVGASGAAYVFIRDAANTWSQQAYIKASNPDFSDRFGLSISVSDDSLVVGAQHEDSSAIGVNGDQSDNSSDSSSAVYAFTRNELGVWNQNFYIKASNTDPLDEFGWSVAVSGDTLAVGTQFEDSAASGVDGDQGDNSAFAAGAVYVFQ